MNKNEKKRDKKKLSKKRRKNAILYPIYKMVSWDLLSFYSIEFLFYTMTKGITASQILIITSIYIFFKILLQIPAVAISDYIGKRKSMILGNFTVLIYIILLMISPNIWCIIIARFFGAFGYDIKTIAEGNLLYDSVATRGGDGIYTKIDSRGSSAYYILDTILSLIAGYLFVINNYIPIYICIVFLIIAIILSFKFKYIHRGEAQKSQIAFSEFLKGYKEDISNSFKFIKRSNRMRSYIIFAAVFYGIIKMMSTYQSNLLTSVHVSEEQFSMIYAVLSLVAAISVRYSKRVQKELKNKTLTFLSLSYIFSIILSGAVSVIFSNNLALPLILIFHTVMKMCDSQWWVTEYTYLKNFTNSKSRTKISFTYELIQGIAATIMAFIGSIILNNLQIQYATILVGIAFLAGMIVILDYMRTRIGLKPEEYTKEDIEFFTNQ